MSKLNSNGRATMTYDTPQEACEVFMHDIIPYGTMVKSVTVCYCAKTAEDEKRYNRRMAAIKANITRKAKKGGAKRYSEKLERRAE